ncbi:MAG: PhnD/SsuA/transferrin family substrate-binding protein [Desulfarculus sp.]|nr:PhnD/SsuA/transferrin family substrate-binding protein [Desulfarculus sp.]
MRVAVLILLPLLAGCDSGSDTQVVDFSRTSPVAKPGRETTAQDQLTMAASAMTSPQETFLAYAQVMEYLAGRLGRPIGLVQRKTYAQIDQLLAKGELDVAFVCSGPYAAQGRDPAFELLAAPPAKGVQITRRPFAFQ